MSVYDQFADMSEEPKGFNEVSSSHLLSIGLLAILPVISTIVYLVSPNLKTAAIGIGVPVFCFFTGLRIIRGSLVAAEEQAALELRPPGQPNRRVAKQLYQGEVIRVETRLHPLEKLKAWTALVMLQPVAIYTLVATSISKQVVGITWLVCMALLGGILYEWGHNRFCVTNTRLFMAQGLTTTEYPSMPLSKLTDEMFKVPFWSKVLARLRVIRIEYGSIIVESAGQEQALNRVKYVPNANAINRLIMGMTLGGVSDVGD